MSVSIFTTVNKNWQPRALLSGLLQYFDFTDFYSWEHTFTDACVSLHQTVLHSKVFQVGNDTLKKQAENSMLHCCA